MKKLLGLVVILLAAFYVGWPAWSAYVVREAVQNGDAARLATKVDFERVRDSLRPVVTQKVEQNFEKYQGGLGAAGGAILGQLRKDLVPKVVEASLKALLTPETIIKIAAEGGTLKDNLERITGAEMGRGVPPAGGGAGGLPQGLGGLLGRVGAPGAGQAPAAPPAPSAPAAGAKPRYALNNVKSFAFNGPLSFRLGVAKDPAAASADLDVEMSFLGGDWKVTGLVPRI